MGKKVNHGRIKPKYNPKPNAEEKRFHDWVRAQGCLICKSDPSIHHVISDGWQRISKDHFLVTPLCWEHHQGQHGYHGLGSNTLFVKQYGIHLYEEGKKLHEEWKLL